MLPRRWNVHRKWNNNKSSQLHYDIVTFSPPSRSLHEWWIPALLNFHILEKKRYHLRGHYMRGKQKQASDNRHNFSRKQPDTSGLPLRMRPASRLAPLHTDILPEALHSQSQSPLLWNKVPCFLDKMAYHTPA